MCYRCLEWEFTNLAEHASVLGYSFSHKIPFDQQDIFIKNTNNAQELISWSQILFKGYFFSSQISFLKSHIE